MPSKIKVTIKYDDDSRSYSQTYPAADVDPGPSVIRDCIERTTDKWAALGNSQRGTIILTDVRPG